ncbi:hypothetical protein [Streptomyces subrutilus]|uniref:Uncharacterized protein n=1 Tax=Streptomyces subrutilus TaxID=36818 RepID=A0A5P2UQ59_9ACTN|nr:hypothetical protein [Streptomyces subrutilus]QEU81253.1 hypothetical protein CP968_25835 [Streptomyces subrutilus]WSJ29424.1 hypothetical protein OG479_08910 [Streptomyces subrutilus]GGZ85958.1 hypothetical protein GCM10010371_52410 [Streptomyces subrutilus]
MPPMLDVSDEVRAEIGDEEADRLLVGDDAPRSYDCTSCRTPGDPQNDRTSTVLFVGEETAVLAFAHATCIPSQVVTVSEEQLQGAVASITGDSPAPAAAPAGDGPQGVPGGQAVLGITSGLVLIGGELHPALVVEPTAPIARPGSDGPGDDFLPLLIEQGFVPVTDTSALPAGLAGWSVLLAAGQLHAVLQPGADGGRPVSWWQAHQALSVTDGWRAAVNKTQRVLVYAAPVGSIGQQPREDLLRDALDKAAAAGRLVAASMPLAGTPGA